MVYNNLNESSPAINQPKGFPVKLRPHQLASVAAMLKLEREAKIIVNNENINNQGINNQGINNQGINNQGINNQGINNENINNLGRVASDQFGAIVKGSEIVSSIIIETDVAILGDKVGAGKSYTLLALTKCEPIPKPHDRFILGNNNYCVKLVSYVEPSSVNLIVVPHNLGVQWSDFAHKSGVKYLAINKTKDLELFYDIDYVECDTLPPKVENVSYKLVPTPKPKGPSGSKCPQKKEATVYERRTLNKKKVTKTLKNYDVIILNINRYASFSAIFGSIKWARVIVDEMDSIKLPRTFQEYGNFNWFVTATPGGIFNRSCMYVSSIFGYRRNMIDYFVVKNDNAFIDKSIVLPKPHVYVIDTMLNKTVDALQEFISPEVMGLINSGNMKDAIIRLNCDVYTEENIVDVLTNKTKIELHNLEAELEYVKGLIPAVAGAVDPRLARIATEIARKKIIIDTVKERVESIKDECCFICTEKHNTPTIMECCKNIFCLGCLIKSIKLNNNCPYCRSKVGKGNSYKVISNSGSKKKKKSGAIQFNSLDKADTLEHILKYIAKNDKHPKILIFSDYSQTFEKIKKNIVKTKLNYEMLAGTPAHISIIIKEFSTGVTNILLLDSKHYGSGLNLQDATYLILFHRMSPELETQVVGRAHRYGRTTNLKIIYLVASNENCETDVSDEIHNLVDLDDLKLIIAPETAIIEKAPIVTTTIIYGRKKYTFEPTSKNKVKLANKIGVSPCKIDKIIAKSAQKVDQ